MNIARMKRHLLTTYWQVQHAFPPATLLALEQAIGKSEATHRGEIRFVVEGSLDFTALLHAQSSRERAIEIFSHLRIWDTEHNNGVLIYLLLADRSVEIVADRGIHAKIESHEWEHICRQMERAFRDGDYANGALCGIAGVTQHLQHHFPQMPNQPRRANELQNRPLLL